MLFGSLLKVLMQPSLCRSVGTARRFASLPKVEALEDRTLLSTLKVVTTADGGPGSLRAAIAAALPGDTIIFKDSLRGHRITLTSGELTIAKDLEIVGPGADKLAISGNHSGRVFEVLGGVNASLAGLAVVDGLTDQGGGILNAGNLSLANVRVTGNEAVGDSPATGLGGGIFNEAGASLTADDTQFVNNQVLGGSGLGFGGGLMNGGNAAVTDCLFRGNSATGGAAGYGAGGAITSQVNATLTITSSQFSENAALDGPNGVARGGAIDSAFATQLTIVDSDFRGNTVTGAAFAAGGALLVRQSTLKVTRCRFVDNESSSAGFAVSGAIENQFGQATIASSVFTGNEAVGSSGANAAGGVMRNVLGTVTFDACIIAHNASLGGSGADGVNSFGQADGGALFNEQATLTVTDCTLSYNLARGGDQGNNSAAPSSDFALVGGAFGAGILSFPSSMLTVTGSTFLSNRALAGASAAGPGPQAVGGAIDSDTNGQLSVSDSTFTGNGAVGGAGAAGFVGGPGIGGAIVSQFSSSATLDHCQFLANRALGGAGGSGANGGPGAGGAVLTGHAFGLADVADSSSASLTSCQFLNNLAHGGRAGAAGTGGDGLGGAILLGSLNAASTPTLVVSTCGIFTNTAAGGAGDASGDGGTGAGGGIWVEGGTASLDHSSILANLAAGGAAGSSGHAGDGLGGGLFVAPAATATALDTSIADNRATTSGDDVYGTL
jgi:hypothetical protein